MYFYVQYEWRKQKEKVEMKDGRTILANNAVTSLERQKLFFILILPVYSLLGSIAALRKRSGIWIVKFELHVSTLQFFLNYMWNLRDCIYY